MRANLLTEHRPDAESAKGRSHRGEQHLLGRRDLGQVVVDARAHEQSEAEVALEQLALAARDQLARDADAHVVRDHVRPLETEPLAQRLDHVGLLEQRVAVALGLVGEAETWKVEQHHAAPSRQLGQDLVPVERATPESRAASAAAARALGVLAEPAETPGVDHEDTATGDVVVVAALEPSAPPRGRTKHS